MLHLSGATQTTRERVDDALTDAPAGVTIDPVGPGRLPPAATWTALAFFSAVILAHGFGLFGVVTYPIVTLGGVLCALIGLRQHRPTLRWPWWAMMATGLIWTIAGMASEVTGNPGDLSASRSLIPDAFALPGYVLFAIALQGLYQARRPQREGDTLLDGIMLAAGAALIVHELVISPTLQLDDAWLMAQLAVAIYPALSMCLLVIALRLAFAGGERSVSFSLLLVGTAALLMGDIVYAFGEIGRIDANPALFEIPYLLVPACIGAAVLHPSIRFVARPSTGPARELGPGRLLGVALALFVPIAVIASHGSDEGRTAVLVLSTVLTATAVVRIITAIRAQAASEAELFHRATHDDLTGLPSRPLLLERTTQLLRRRDQPGVALLFLDIDQFKFVNDSMGHKAGDALLVLVADRIAGSVRDEDMVGRISGDEFVIVAAGLDAAGGYALADRARHALADPFELHEGEVFVSASVGVAVAEGGGSELANVLLQEADTAMYISKESGRNTTTLFDSSMRDGIARRVDIERALRKALDARGLTVAFQPIVAGPTGQILGFEALVRWELDGRMMSPAEFIPIAEDSGLVVPLGSFVLDEACRQLAWWRRHVPGAQRMYMSVNMSPRQVRASDVVDTVAEALQRHGLPADALWLEITESVMLEDSITTAAVMSGLRALGIRLAVDDFGTGYSSLSYLKRFPVSRVKIDRAFVSGLGKHEADSSLVAAIIAMASALDLEPVAEGVETHEQARLLLELGCTQMQGFLFGAPAPAAEVPALIAMSTSPDARTATRSRRCTSGRK